MAMDVTYNSQKIIDGLEVTLPVDVTYNGSTIATLNAGDTKTLQCNGKVMASNVGIGDKTLQCNGKLMASDVVVEVGGGAVGETWVINESPTGDLEEVFVDFKSNDTEFIAMGLDVFGLRYRDRAGAIATAWLFGRWANQAYRTVTFETPPTGELLTWLQANAVKQ